MKPFNLEAALRGEKISTKSGKEVRLICTDRKRKGFPLLALVNEELMEEVISYTSEGKAMSRWESDYDLVMALEKRVYWINLYPHGTSCSWMKSKEEADRLAGPDRLLCAKVELEL